MTESIGRVLGDRYRIIAPIGRGASAQVFLADDVRLRRRVALKVLHAALADDADFLRRFQAEAQAAAALNHPNVMAVYDWGHDPHDDVPYLVLEYLGGGSLRTILDQGRLLTPSQALLVGLEATRALEYAHGRGFVHRDIKPANLLFGDEGRLRIADFGLARALAEAAWTEPQGAVLGTARYASPEQVQGEALTAVADVYSLALVLVEAVTGQVPFATDTTLGTLMARVDKQLEATDDLGPLGSIVERAAHPDPQERLDAHGLAVALMGVASQLPRPQPLVLAGALAAADSDATADPTLLGRPGEGTVVAAGRDADDHDDLDDLDVAPFVLAGPPGVMDDDLDDHLDDDLTSFAVATGAVPADDLDVPDFMARRPDPDPGPDDLIDLTDPALWAAPTETVESEARTTAVSPVVDPTRVDALPLAAPGPVIAHDGDDGDGDDDDGPRGPRRWPKRLAIGVVLAVIAATVALLVAEITATPTHAVPGVVGLDVADARERLAALDFEVSETLDRRDGTEAGEVLSVRPAVGTDLAEGEVVQLVVSEGNTFAAVPTGLRGVPLAEATQRLEARGLKVEAQRRFDEEIAKDLVIALGPGTPPKLVKGELVTLVVSDGPEPRVVPEGLPGLTVAEATAVLADLQLQAEQQPEYNDDVAEGVVIGTAPGAGQEAARDSVVTLVVSLGPRPVPVPDVSTVDTFQQAAALLREAGLVPGDVSGPAEGVPVGTSPAAGTEVRPGSVVDIVLGNPNGNGRKPADD